MASIDNKVMESDYTLTHTMPHFRNPAK